MILNDNIWMKIKWLEHMVGFEKHFGQGGRGGEVCMYKMLKKAP